MDFKSLDLTYSSGSTVTMSDGAVLYYEISGPADAPVITVINNYFLIAPIWRNFTANISQQYRVLAYDLRNQGASSRVTGELTFDRHVADLAELHDSLGIDKSYLVGTSISTLIARDYALSHSARVSGMALFGPVFNPFGDRRRRALTKSWITSLQQSGPRGLFDHIFPLVYSDRTIESGGSATYLAMRERFLALNSQVQMEINLKASLTVRDNPEALRSISCPALLAVGEADFLASPRSMEAAAAIMPRATVSVIAGAGHVPYYEATAAFEELVLDFVENAESAARASA
ncbi:alpha/beta fold hydrolase [Rhodococcoides fascians]|uniref:alpha/beta fold hydrolase n=1 Tax=Rhodococcoides fascians TaxID=1828 RepID=UPI001E3E3172|nr:alpha/beta hydrolase [Rhodococcus fascians]